MNYYIATEVRLPFDEAVEAVEAALKEEGFGVVTRIDMQATLKAKLGVDFRPYVILGACNPSLAHEALQLEDKVGTMLPCNVIVQATANNRCEVAAIDPVESMQAIPNARLKSAAREVRAKLERVIEKLRQPATVHPA
ncbi:MAG: DUF302 domain-containing protein [Bacillota bacterium]